MKHLTKTIGIVAILLMTWSGFAAAQVAAPHLNPLIPEAFNAYNPATLPWSGPSRIGLALKYDSTEESTTNGVTQVEAEGEGKFLGQGRYVGETFSFSAETLQIDFTVPNNTTQTATIKAAAINGAMLLGDVLAIGVGRQAQSYTQEDSSINATQESEGVLNYVGVSIQVLEGLFLGAAGGTETNKISQKVPAFLIDVSEEQEREVMRLGLGYYTRSDDSGLHIEVYQQTKEFVEFPTLGGSAPEEETSGATLEVVFVNILLGIEKFSNEQSTPNSGVVNEDDETVLSLGWVPAQGFTVVASRFERESTQPASPTVTNDVGNLVSVGWMF